MSTVHAILPIKSFDQAKQRLRDTLGPVARRALVEAMFTDALLAVRRCTHIDRLIVVSDDNNAQQIAAGYGATVLVDERQGHSQAAIQGVSRAVADGATRALLIPGDCPLLDPSEIDELIAHAAGARSALIVPDRHGTGTNALLLSPADAMDPSFGPDSCQRHLSDAEQAGLEGEVVSVSSLAMDVDTPDDLKAIETALAERHGGAAHTRGMLAQLARTEPAR